MIIQAEFMASCIHLNH